MPRNRPKIPRIIKFRCLCDHESDVSFIRPALMKTIHIEGHCAGCDSIWMISIKNDHKLPNGAFQTSSRPTRLTKKASDIMLQKQLKNQQPIQEKNMGNQDALNSAIKLIADAVNDTVQALQPGQSIIKQLFEYKNMVGDLLVLIPELKDIPAEVSQLAPEDYVALVQNLVTQLSITDAKAQAIVAGSLKLLNDLIVVIVPDAEVLIAAIRS